MGQALRVSLKTSARNNSTFRQTLEINESRVIKVRRVWTLETERSFIVAGRRTPAESRMDEHIRKRSIGKMTRMSTLDSRVDILVILPIPVGRSKRKAARREMKRQSEQ